MSKKTSTDVSVFDQIKAGLEDSIAFSKGKLSLRTPELPSPPPKASSGDVARIRRKLRMSQAVFAALLNVSPKTVQSWEQGLREPSDAALRLLQLIGKSTERVWDLIELPRAMTEPIQGPSDARRVGPVQTDD